jgi:hypothetical protein
MATVFTTTQLVGLLYCLGFPVSIQAAADSKGERRWHPHFWFHGIVYLSVLGSGVAALALQWNNGGRNFAPYLQVLLLIAAWTVMLWPIVKSLNDYRSEEHPRWLELEQGRNKLISSPIFSTLETTAVEQMKELLVTLVNRVETNRRGSSVSPSVSTPSNPTPEFPNLSHSSASLSRVSAAQRSVADATDESNVENTRTSNSLPLAIEALDEGSPHNELKFVLPSVVGRAQAASSSNDSVWLLT